jgi:glycosyltransferase involved in cell wall biosynthesis
MPHSEPFTCLLLIRSLGVGGAERQLVQLARGLRAGGAHVTVITFYPGGAFHSALDRSGVNVVSVDKKNRWDILGFLWRLLRVIRQKRPDVLYSFLPSANLSAVFVRYFSGLRLVVWGVRASALELTRYNWLVRLELLLCAVCSRLADLIVCNSLAGLEHHVAQGYPRRKMRVISNGIDCSVFRFDLTARPKVRAEWNVRDDDVLIGLVARVDPMKGHSDFLAAAALLAPKAPRLRFVCIGNGPKEMADSLRATSLELGLADRVIWASPREDVSAIYSALDVFVSASVFGEGFSNAVAEAMACERVCVVTDVGDSSSVIADLGRVVPPRAPSALADAIHDLASLSPPERAHLGRAARERIESSFSVSRMVNETARLIGAPRSQPAAAMAE